MEDNAFRKGLSVTAIILIVLSAALLSLNATNTIVFGEHTAFYGFFFIAAVAIPLLAVLIVLTRYYNRTDTVEEMMAAIAVRYSIFGWFFVFLIKFISGILDLFFADFYNTYYTTIYLCLNSFNVCVVGTLVLAIGLRKLPKMKIEKRNLKFGQIILLIMMMYGLTQVGSLMGMPIHLALTSFSSLTTNAEESISNLKSNLIIGSDIYIRVITIGILPAIFEELLFRKFLIDRTIRHGEFVSCAMSGIMFGLWHGNFQQFFFAFFIGVMFAFVYIRTGKIIYTMIFHASLNVVTSTVTAELLAKLIDKMGPILKTGDIEPNFDYDALMTSILPLLLILLVWIIVLAGMQIAGFVLLIVKRKKFKLVAREGELGRKEILRKLTHNVTMWVFFAFALLLFVYTYLPDILAVFISRR